MHLMYQLRKYASLLYTFLLFLGRFLVLCVIVAGPWKNGGADLEYQRFLLWLAFGAGICALGALIVAPKERRKETNFFPILLGASPLVLGLVLCVLQITPLSEQTLAKVSPHVLELKEFLTPSYENESSTDPAASQKNAEQLARFSEAAIPLTEDSQFDINEALALENSTERKLLKDVPTWGNTISVYPLATREWFPLFWGGFLLLVSTAVLFNSKKSRKVLFIVAAVVGVSYALLCLAIRANPSIREWPLFSMLTADDDEFRLGFGTYVNKNNCGGYLVYCLAPCVFLASMTLIKSSRLVNEERRKRNEENKEDGSYYEIRKDAKWKVLLGDFFDLFSRKLVFYLSFVVVILAAIAVSMSRGATVAALALALCAFGVLALKKDNRRYWYVFLIVVAATLGLIESVGLSQRVDDRMSTLVTEDSNGETAMESDSRLENWRAARETARDYYWLGSGLGTYSLVNGANDVATKAGSIFYYAENSFYQTLVELGRVGCALFVLEYLLLTFCFVRLLWKSHGSEEYAIGVGGIALTIGQLITSLADFGVYLSGNLTTLAVLYGAFLSCKKSDSHRSKTSKSKRRISNAYRRKAHKESQNVGWGAVCACGAILLICVLGGKWALSENRDYVYRTSLLKETRFTDAQYVHLSDTSLDSLISSFERYVQRRDDSVEIRNRLATLEISRYRLRLFDFLKSQRPDDKIENLWKETAVPQRLQTMLKYQELGFDVAASSIRDNRFAAESILPAAIHTAAARRICPMEPQTYVFLSETVPLASDLSWKQNRLLIELYARRAVLFGKYNSDVLYNVGFFTGAVGLKTLQSKIWRRTIDFSGKYLRSVLLLIAIDTPPNKLKETIADLLPDNPRVLASASNVLGGEYKKTPLYSAVLECGRKYFENQPEEKKNSEYYSYSGRFFIGLGNYEQAYEDFQKAYEANPTDYGAFFRLVELLCNHPNELHKEEECVKLLRKFSVGKSGRVLTRCEELMKRADKNLRDKHVAESFLKISQEEKEMDERIKKSDSSLDATKK